MGSRLEKIPIHICTHHYNVPSYNSAFHSASSECEKSFYSSQDTYVVDIRNAYHIPPNDWVSRKAW